MIQELHTLNQTKVIEMQKLMKELRENTTTEEKKIEIRKEYAKLIRDKQKQAMQLMETLNEKRTAIS